MKKYLKTECEEKTKRELMVNIFLDKILKFIYLKELQESICFVFNYFNTKLLLKNKCIQLVR